MPQLELSHFVISGNISDPIFDTAVVKDPLQVTVWRSRQFFEEFVTSFTVPPGDKYSHKFSIPFDESGDYQLYLKVNYGEQELPYTVTIESLDIVDETIFYLEPEANQMDIKLEMPVEWLADEDGYIFERTGQLIDVTTQKPYGGQKVRVSFTQDLIEIADFGIAFTNGNGYFPFTLVINRTILAGEGEAALKCEVLDTEDAVLSTTSITINEDNKDNKVWVFETTLSLEQPENSSSISDLASGLSFEIETEITTYLSTNSISTLKDIRRAGGLRYQEDLAESEYTTTINLLDAHAQLELVSNDYELNHFLIEDKGYTTLYKVAEKDRAEFIKDTEEYGSSAYLKLAKIHTAAKAGERVMRNMHIGMVLKSGATVNGEGIASINPSFQAYHLPKCSCDDCKAAVSPLAYLSDLIEYTVEHVSWEGTYTDKETKREELQDLFCLKFLQIKNICSEINNTVCQYRVAIEVLNCYKGHPGTELTACQTTAFNSDEKLYLNTAYFVLLEEMGTSFSELRDTVKDTVERQQQLADRLGIVPTYGVSPYNTLVKMFLDPRATSGTSQITNGRLEEIFGFRDYTKDAIYAQPEPLIKAWKQAYLEQLWLKQAHPEYLFDSINLPIIEPDLIGPDDFRNPVVGAGTTAFDYWIKRREFLDNTVLNDKLKNEGLTLTPKGIELGVSTFTINDTTAYLIPLNSQIEVLGPNDAINGFYTVAAVGSDTIDVIGQVANVTYTDVKLKVQKALAIQSVDEGNNRITVKGDLTEITTIGASGIKIIMSDVNNSSYLYTDISIVGTAGATTELQLPTSSLNASSQLGMLVYVYEHELTASTTQALQMIRVHGDVDSLPGTINEVVITNSTGNDGIYNVAYSGVAPFNPSPEYNSGTGITTFFVRASTPLVSPIEDGIARIGVADIDVIAINPGARTFKVGGPSLVGYISALDTISIEAGAGSNDGDYTVTTVSYTNNKNSIAVTEAIDSDVKTGNLAYLFDIASVDISDDAIFTISSDLTDFYAVTGQIKIVKGNGSIETYTIADFDTTSSPGNTIITLDASTTGLDTADKVKYTVTIDEIDISGRAITAAGVLVGHLFIGDSIVISDSTVDANDGVYTISDIVLDGGNTIFTVVQALEVDLTPDGTISFSKLVNIHQQQPLVSGLFTAMAADIVYPGIPTTIKPWILSTIQIANLSTIKNALVSGTNASTWETAIATEMNLTRDAFIRMVEIYEKDNQHKLYPNAERVTSEEWEEFYNILLSSVKRAFNDTWLTEESLIAFDQTNFWFALQEPIVGNWPKAFNPNHPIIDPQLIDVDQLPGRTAASHAISIWNQRNDYLSYLKNSLRTIYQASGIDEVLKHALGTPFAGDNVPFSLTTLAAGLTNLNQSVIDSTIAKIENVLGISVDEFNQIVQFRSKFYAGGASISSEELDRLLSLLVEIAKRRYLYPIWVAQESVDSPTNLVDWGTTSLGFRNETNTGFDKYWLAMKAQLPKWRTSPAHRNAWQQKLEAVHRLPIIDPDIVQIGEIKGASGTAYTKWQSRKGELDTLLTAIKAMVSSTSPDDVAKLEAIYTYYLALENFGEFELLDLLESTGIIISGHLRQIGLDYSGYRRLLALYNSAIDGTSNDLLANEWEEVYAILLQVVKWREKYAVWNAEEKTEDISLSPVYFNLLPDYYPVNLLGDLEVVPLWRASFANRRSWTRTLKGAIAQQETMAGVVEAIVDETEDKVLPIIRDALVKALGEEHAPLEESAQKLIDRFLTDFKVNCCQDTTRVAHSIDVLQRLLWTLHTGVNPELDIPGMVLNAENFGEEWRWLGSYADWRSAMFVFMYPENLLAPELRRDATPKFREIVNAVSQSSRFTPDDACYYGKEYEKYINDVSQVVISAACNYVGYREPASHVSSCETVGSQSLTSMMAVFGVGRQKQILWNLVETKEASAKVGYWRTLHNAGSNVEQILGAAYINSNVNLIYITSNGDDGFEMQVLHFDPINFTWAQEANAISLPDECDFNSLKILKAENHVDEFGNACIPFVYKAKMPDGGIYYNQINKAGKDLDGESQLYLTRAKSRNLRIIDFIISEGKRYLILLDLITKDYVFHYFDRRWWESNEDGAFISVNTNKQFSYIGSVHRNTVSLIFSNFNGSFITCNIVPSRVSLSTQKSIKNLNDFENYLKHTFGLTLTSVPGPAGSNLNNFRNYLATIPGSSSTPEQITESIEHFFKETYDNQNKAFGDDWKLVDEHLATKYNRMPNSRTTWYGLYYVISNLLSKTGQFNFLVSDRKSINVNERTITIPLNIFPIAGTDNIIVHTTGNSPNKHHIVNNPWDNEINNKALDLYLSPIGGILVTTSQTVVKELDPMYKDIWISHGVNLNVNLSRRVIIKTHYDTLANQNFGWCFETYLVEAYYFLPLFLARNLIKHGHYEEALGWLTSLYDFRQSDVAKQYIYEGLKLDDVPDVTQLTRNFDNWLLDPLDPHKLGRTRKNAYLKFTVRTIVECLLQYADANFTIDTVESNSKAAELYEMAISLLKSDVFNNTPSSCNNIALETIEEIKCQIPDRYKPDMDQLSSNIRSQGSRFGNRGTAEAAMGIFTTDILANVEDEGLYDFYGNVTVALENLTTAVDDQIEVIDMADISIHKEDTKQTYTWSSNSTEEAEEIIIRATQKAQQSLVISLENLTGKTQAELEEAPETMEWLNKNLREEQETTPVPVYKEGSPLAPASSDQVLMMHQSWPNSSGNQMKEYAIPYIPILNQDFCVPANPVSSSLLLWAELNLFKLRNCMNIAGMKRQVDIYAAPTDATSGMPYIGAGGQIVLPGSIRFVPTQYRYQYIIQRAKELVSLAQQLEANLLSLLEKKDAESYSLMKAKQDMALARANVKLQDLRIKVSEGEVDLAVMQKERSELQVEGLEEMIAAGLNEFEEQMIMNYYVVATLDSLMFHLTGVKEEASILGDVIFGTATNAASKAAQFLTTFALNQTLTAVNTSKQFLQANINANSIRASQARREQEWNFQKTLAEKDVNIGQQGIRVAKDRLRVTGQERQISSLQLGHAEDTVNFLNNKFTNVELYSWMSGVIEGVYAYFLRQATATAKMAQNQLAFERQELPPPFIQDDYWQSPADSAGLSALGGGDSGVDRRGMTGSARLLQDIYKVDQFAFETDRRKLQLSKTFSLSRMAAVEFQRFRETGEITFETLMEHFDRDFPGHYVRLIKKVNVSIIALVPPVDGVKATLTSSGISHVVTKGDTFQEVIVRRDPEVIAFTGSQSATGMFDMQPDERFSNPFEGSGVHTRWQLQLPTDTNLFNFDTIADVLLTIEYTALHSYDYQQQVLRKLDPEYSAERAFSFREELPDQYYELNNPDQSDTPMEVSFDVSAFDFPAGVKDIYIKSVKVYYVVDEDKVTGNTDVAFPKTTMTLSSAQITNGEATPNKSGLISTESGNGGSFLAFIGKQPYGKWTYKLPNDNLVKNLFQNEVVRDVIFIIGFGGTVKARVNP